MSAVEEASTPAKREPVAPPGSLAPEDIPNTPEYAVKRGYVREESDRYARLYTAVIGTVLLAIALVCVTVARGRDPTERSGCAIRSVPGRERDQLHPS